MGRRTRIALFIEDHTMLTNKQFENFYRAWKAIENVLEGRTADGRDSIPYKVSFTREMPALRAAAHQLRLILCHCHKELTVEDVTPLTVKLLWHLTRTGKTTQNGILALSIIPFARAISHAPHLVRGKGNLNSILRRQQLHLARERAKKWYGLGEAMPERKVLWSNGPYTVEEATDPRHLVYDSLALGHCVGSLYNNAALAHAGLTPHDPDSIHYLHYWIKIRSREVSILTLAEAGVPLITIEYHPGTKTVVAAQGKVTPYGEVLPLPQRAKEPLTAAVKAITGRKVTARLLKSMPFEPNAPSPGRQPLPQVTPS